MTESSLSGPPEECEVESVEVQLLSKASFKFTEPNGRDPRFHECSAVMFRAVITGLECLNGTDIVVKRAFSKKYKNPTNGVKFSKDTKCIVSGKLMTIVREGTRLPLLYYQLMASEIRNTEDDNEATKFGKERSGKFVF